MVEDQYRSTPTMKLTDAKCNEVQWNPLEKFFEQKKPMWIQRLSKTQLRSIPDDERRQRISEAH